MNFEQYLDQAWDLHVMDSAQVAQDFSRGLSLVQSPQDLSALIVLMTHVMGEHLGRWEDGVELLQDLKAHGMATGQSDIQSSLDRSMAALRMAGGLDPELSGFSHSDQIRVHAVAAAALSGHDVNQARVLFEKALRMSADLDSKDPANRALAIMGNNLAGALEEKPNRQDSETELMIEAAIVARKYWELAGTWSQVAGAEFRLSQSYMQGGNLMKAREHLQKSLEIRKKEAAPSLGFFWDYEALVRIENATGDAAALAGAVEKLRYYLGLVPEADRSACSVAMEKLGIK